MSDKYAEKRAQWHAENYTQVKISVRPELAEAFKAICKIRGASVASVLSGYMHEYIAVPAQKEHLKAPDYSVRRKRKAAALKCLEVLEQLRDAEELSRDNMPDNLRGSANYERADETVQVLTDAIESIRDAYS